MIFVDEFCFAGCDVNFCWNRLLFCCIHLLDFCLLEHGGASRRRRQAGDGDFAGSGIMFCWNWLIFLLQQLLDFLLLNFVVLDPALNFAGTDFYFCFNHLLKILFDVAR